MVLLLSHSIIYITLGIFLQLLVEVKSQVATLKPDLRIFHTATLINNKLYILGGIVSRSNITSPKEKFL